MTDLSKIVDQLSSLTVLEAAELAKMLEEKWGVSAAAPVAVAAAPGAAGGAAAAEEQTEFAVILKSGGEKFGIIWFDAHADMNVPASTPSGNIHGMALMLLGWYVVR